jgi:hypothetical protein
MEEKEDKVKISARIPKDLDERFRRLIAQTSGKYSGRELSKYIVHAISLYLQFQNTQQQNTKTLQIAERRILKVDAKWQQICKYIFDNYGGFELKAEAILPAKMLNDAMNNVCGIDKRTQEDWISRFQGKYIKKISLGAYTILRDSSFIVDVVSDEELK